MAGQPKDRDNRATEPQKTLDGAVNINSGFLYSGRRRSQAYFDVSADKPGQSHTPDRTDLSQAE